MEQAFATAVQLARQLRARRAGSRELLEYYLDRIDRYNPALNAVVAMDVAGARAAADEADRELARGGATGPLHGVPMTVKESFDVAGLPTTWGRPPCAATSPAGRRRRSGGCSPRAPSSSARPMCR